MDIETMRSRKREAEQKIADILDAFSEETKISITGIDVSFYKSTPIGQEYSRSICGPVKITMEL